MGNARRARVAIVGAGFGGLSAARGLRRADVDVVLVDQNNYHLFTPLLYEVGTALLDSSEIAYPVRGIFHHVPNVDFRKGRVVEINLGAREVRTAEGRLAYDYLVVSAGSVNKGPTGVEFAGALSELVHLVLRKDFPRLRLEEVEIHLVEAVDHVLGAFDTRLQTWAVARLQRMGVDVVLGAAVEATWLTVHLILLINFRSRVLVLINWAYDYFFYDRPVRLILRAARNREAPENPAD